MSQPTVLVTIRELPASCRPGFVSRCDGWACVTLDPTAVLLDALTICVQQLHPDELAVLREAFGEPPVGQPVADFWTREDVHISLELIPDSVLTSRSLRIKQALRQQMLGA